MTNHQILQISPGATPEEIKKAYHKMAHIHHPDKGGDKKKFIEVKNAYEALMKNPGNGGDEKPFRSYQGGFANGSINVDFGGNWSHTVYYSHDTNEFWQDSNRAQSQQAQKERYARAQAAQKNQDFADMLDKIIKNFEKNRKDLGDFEV